MKIGILTFHRAHNYGALLQAYALKTYLTSLGHEVEFVDYWPQYHEDRYAAWSWRIFFTRSLYRKLRMTVKFLLSLSKGFIKRRQVFLNFIKKYIIHDNQMNPFAKAYDAVVYGSDTIWKLFGGYGFDKAYYGDNKINAEKHITYSASIFDNFNKESEALFKKNLGKFSAISVRESTLQKAIQPLTELKVHHTIDPVFLLAKEEWAKIASPRIIDENYIFFYNQQFNGKIIRTIGEHFSSKMNIPVYVLNIDFTIMRIQYKKVQPVKLLIGPNEFLSLIQNSEIVVSASFHGVAFSILFQKEFYTIIKDGKERVKSLLKILSLEERLINDLATINIIPINYQSVNEKLKDIIDFSKNYLKSALL
jgi:polysaccharide pyruvyl transferase WcaK-like protein